MTAEQEAILKVIPKTGIRVDDLYADLRKQMRPEVFRRACDDLYRAGVLVFGGGLPCARKGRAVVVFSEGVQHDLANGDWLIYGCDLSGGHAIARCADYDQGSVTVVKIDFNHKRIQQHTEIKYNKNG